MAHRLMRAVYRILGEGGFAASGGCGGCDGCLGGEPCDAVANEFDVLPRTNAIRAASACLLASVCSLGGTGGAGTGPDALFCIELSSSSSESDSSISSRRRSFLC